MAKYMSALNALFVAQFLSAFVDNMILFVVQAIIVNKGYPEYYLPFVQSTFLAAYILCSPWVGRYADRNSKAGVLVKGNLVKTLGVLLMLVGCNPAISYAVVGVGAVIYSPAKYGILPLLAKDDKELLKANSGLESYTILAILAGSVAGGFLADYSVQVALGICVFLYGASVAVNRIIPGDPGNSSITYSRAIPEFISDVRQLMKYPQSHYAMIGTGSFWMTSAVLRMMMFVWVPLTLGIASTGAVSLLVAVTGVGLAVGAAITPFFISIQTYHRTVWYGLAMGLAVLLLMAVHSVAFAALVIFFIGALGGMYIVPMNACLQQVGHRTIGAGKTIAVQNFVENNFMFLGVGIYTLAAKGEVPVPYCLLATGISFLLMVGYLMWVLRRKSGSAVMGDVTEK